MREEIVLESRNKFVYCRHCDLASFHSIRDGEKYTTRYFLCFLEVERFKKEVSFVHFHVCIMCLLVFLWCSVPCSQTHNFRLKSGGGGRAEPRFAFKLAKKRMRAARSKPTTVVSQDWPQRNSTKLLHEKKFIFCTTVPVCNSVIAF